MNWISNLFSRHWRNINLLSIVLVSVILIVAPSGFVPTVSQGILSVFYWPFAEIKTSIGDLQAVGSGKPSKVAKRVGRRVAGKNLGKLMRKLFG